MPSPTAGWLQREGTSVRTTGCNESVVRFAADLIVVLLIFAAFGYLLYRLARSLFKAAT